MSTTPLPGMPHPGVFEGIDHVGIAVHDLYAAIDAYTSTYGMRVSHEEVNEEQGVHEAMLEIGPAGAAGPPIQLVAPLSDDTPVARFLAKRGEGLHHVAYTVRDIASASAQLRQQGMELLYDTYRRGTGGSKVNFIHPKNAGGVLVELVEHSIVHIGDG
jgi:methylmalonyl-CoA/ethylmalonyl-CoA epimerase